MMDTKTAKSVCLQLLAAESEAEVLDIIKDVPAMKARENWCPLSKNEMNLNIIHNQTSDPSKALTELMTNMADAVLTKHVRQKDICPKSAKAPQNMHEAVQLIKKIPGGKLSNLDARDQWLREFAKKNLVIGVTSTKSKSDSMPCYTFIDNGEGQKPEDFASTFLSLSRRNKSDIPFVQGKYNMGSSGVLRYCGECGFKLIISRHHEGKSGWGWTLIRRRPEDSRNMIIYEYFALSNGNIPAFPANTLHPLHTKDGKPYDDMKLGTGTVVKLFDYVPDVGTSVGGPRELLLENMVETPLPFYIYDFRVKAYLGKGPDRARGVDPRLFCGMEFLLLRYHGGEEIAIGDIIDPKLGELSISAICLEPPIPGWLEPRRSVSRILHSVNGQVHFKQTRGYLSKQCKLPALMDRVVIIVDASNLNPATQLELWKADRENVVDSKIGKYYKQEVTKVIKESAILKALNHKFAKEELKRATSSGSKKLLQRLVENDSNFAALLADEDPKVTVPPDIEDSWDGGKYSPTFIILENRFRKNEIEIPLNQSRSIVARTDAQNGYFRRADNRGKVILPDEIWNHFSIVPQLHNGRLSLTLTPQQNALFSTQQGGIKVGDRFKFPIALIDDSMPDELKSEEEVILRIVGQKEKSKNPPGPTPPPKQVKGLPEPKLLTRNGEDVDGKPTEAWPTDINFDDKDGGLILNYGEEGTVYKINYDNVHHLNCRKQQKDAIARQVVTEKYILGMLVFMLAFERALKTQESADADSANGRGAEFDEEAFRRMAVKAAATTILIVSETLPKVIDRASITDDDDAE
ncbi:MAG: hypothetical protein MJE68_28855 [Proteobacteria bacterium]|nr:hypothetical protein [Pseudomonadota bacterium]